MHSNARNYALVCCLFVFLFVIIGGGLHLNPGGAFLEAATGTGLSETAYFGFAIRKDEYIRLRRERRRWTHPLRQHVLRQYGSAWESGR